MIAEQEWNDFTYEDVDRWPKERVDYYITRMNATGKVREEQREEERIKQRKPDRYPMELWRKTPENIREKIIRGEINKPSIGGLRDLIEKVEDNNE